MKRDFQAKSIGARVARYLLIVSAAVFSLLLLCIGGVKSQTVKAAPSGDAVEKDVTQGALRVVDKNGGVVECPLKHTDVKASISGYLARVTVTQTFVNPSAENIEAVYVFPLPHTAAVDDMTMLIGERKIVGVIKRRAEARAIYEQALQQGYTASLLEQERPNIFTQSVGNIKPKQEVKIVISYFDALSYDMGTYEFHFPMVVGPRYNAGAPFAGTPPPVSSSRKVPKGPGDATPAGSNNVQTPVGAMPAEGVNPPVLQPNMRNGHDVSLSLTLDAGIPVHNLKVLNHKVVMNQTNKQQASITLSPEDNIPNKDFVFRYSVTGVKPEMGLLANCEHSGDGYFMLMVQPKIDEALAKAPPREIVFMVDISGSMSGAPTEKNKQIMREFFNLSKPDDTIQVITFASTAQKLFEKAVPASSANTEKALQFTNNINGGGGTEMMKAINMALTDPIDAQRVRIVVMLTDGFIGNEAEIIDAVGKHTGDNIRFWTVGIGSSPNRFLLDGVAKKGGGMSATVELNTDPKEVVQNLVDRIHRAQLAHISINWGSLSVFDVYPRRIPELWAGRPVILFGRYVVGGLGKVTISGTAEGKPLSYSLEVNLPMLGANAHAVLTKMWARNKIEELMAGMNYGDNPEVIEEVTQTALDYHLMSQYTSLVAVDVNNPPTATEQPKMPRRIGVAVPLPEGVSFDGIFGSPGEREFTDRLESLNAGDVYGRVDSSSARAMPTFARKMPATVTRSVTPGKPGAYGPVGATGATGTGGGSGRRTQLEKSKAVASPPMGIMPGFMPSTMPAPSTPIVTNGRSGLAIVDDDKGHFGFDQPIGGIDNKTAQMRHTEATTALAEAKKLQETGELMAAFSKAQQAYLLETAYLNAMPYNNDGTRDSAGQCMATVSEAMSQANVKQLPALKTRLDFVIKDQSLIKTLELVTKAAGIPLTILSGSMEDAAQIGTADDLRVHYLDLRNATVAQALDWLLAPRVLCWQVKDRAILVASTRRLPGIIAWTYDASDLLIAPTKENAPAVDDTSSKLLHLIHLMLGQQGDDALTPDSSAWVAPGCLLVYGNAKTQEKVAALLQALSSTKESLTGLLPAANLAEGEALQQVTSARWTARADTRKTHTAAVLKAQTMEALTQYSWALYASALRGQIDNEALTELEIAWNGPTMQAILKGPNGWLALRSAWLISEAAKAPARTTPMLVLSTFSSQLVYTRLVVVENALAAKKVLASDYFAALYAALCVQNTQQLPGDGLQPAVPKNLLALLTAPQKDTDIPVAHALAAALLTPSPGSDAEVVKYIRAQQIAGDDQLLLTAILAKQRNGEVRKAFAEEMQDMLGKQQLDGNVLVAINRLLSAPPVLAGR